MASGKRSLAECQRCGEVVRYTKTKTEYWRGQPKNNTVCRKCYDKDHPQLWVGSSSVSDDPSLKDPNPDSEVVTLFGFYPYIGNPGNNIQFVSGTLGVRIS